MNFRGFRHIVILILIGMFTGTIPVYARELKVIVLDPGHGGSDSGVKGLSGIQEKGITLILAKKLALALQERMGVRVVLTRDEDETLSVYQRTGVANNQKADLFISLHVNGDFSPHRTGMQIYTLAAGDYTGPGGDSPPEALAWESAQNEFFLQSQQVAQAIYEQASRSSLIQNCQLRQAPLLVLKGAHLPACLIELDYMSSKSAEERLLTGEYQAELVRVICEGLMDYQDSLSGWRI